MRAILSLPALGRRTRRTWVIAMTAVLGSVFALTLGSGASGLASENQSEQQAQQPPGRMFASDAGILFNPVKPDRTADFEMIMARLKEALAKSEDPTRQQQAKGWRVFKAVEPGPNGSVLYLFIMDPTITGADYTISKILAEAFPTEVQDLYTKFSEAYAAGQTLVNLDLIQDFGQ